jgi:hypothetical protein
VANKDFASDISAAVFLYIVNDNSIDFLETVCLQEHDVSETQSVFIPWWKSEEVDTLLG